MPGDYISKIAELQMRHVKHCLRLFCEQQFRTHLLMDARSKIRRRLEIKWDNHRPAEQAAKESRDPFGTVLTPEENAIACTDSACLELACELKRA